LNLILFMPFMSWGGMGKIASDISCTLPQSVNQTIVLLEDRVAYPYQGRLLILGKDCLKPHAVKGMRLLLNVLKFRRVLKEVKPDVVLAFHHDARVVNFLSGLSLPTFRYTTMLSAQGVASQYGKYSAGSRTHLHRFLIYLIHKYAQKVIACTEGVKADLISAFGVEPKKIEVISNSVDALEIRQMASEAVEHSWFSEGVPIIVSSGRLVFEKNQLDLIKAFALVRKEKPCRLALIGDGNLRDAVARLAGELGVSEDVLFAGYQKNPSKFVAKSTVFAFSSLYDAQPFALIEAMAVGCPIVAYDCPVGPRDLLAPGTSPSTSINGIEQAEFGLLVPPGNVEILAKAILQLLDDVQMRGRYSQAGLERAMHFSLQDMAERYFAVLNSVSIK
jgi:glycosyltransferase involved in cell wall biosynthesis